MPVKKKRCPNGSKRKPVKTGVCVRNSKKNSKKDGKKNSKKKSKKLKKKTSKKKCPGTKLLNPKTNRCINDNVANRKKLNMSVMKKVSSVSNLVIKHCSKFNNLISVELEQIKFNRMDGNKIILNYGNIELNTIKFLNEGTYGKVYMYSNGLNKIAVKTYKNSNDEEIDIIRMLNKRKISCDTINSRIIEVGGIFNRSYISVMDIMSGGLDKMNGKLSNVEIFNVIKDVAKHLKCLDRAKLSYTDLKCANILFKCKNKKVIKTVVGDLGGICNKGSYNVATWVPFEYRFDRGMVKCGEPTMVWCLGVMVLELLKANTDMFHWSMIKDYNEAQVIKKVIDTYTKYKLPYRMGTLLLLMLSPNPKLPYRATLQQIINYKL